MIRRRPSLSSSIQRFRALFVLALLLVALVPGIARAHGDLESTIPEAGSKVDKAPDHIIINFTEPPTRASVVEVRDGCKDDIIDEAYFEERVAHVFLTDGEPGKWKVSYRVVSAADGHKTEGSYALTVAGKSDCSNEAPDDGGNGKDAGNDNGGDGDAGTASGPRGPAGNESSFPLVPVALGTVGVIALALVARRLSG